MYDIIFISNTGKTDDAKYLKLKSKYPLLKRAHDIKEAQLKSVTRMVWIIYDDTDVLDTFNFDYKVPVWDEQYVHVFKNNEFYDGICLIQKCKTISDRELSHRFYVDSKEIDIQASAPCLYEQFYIDTYEEYLTAVESSSTELFWMVPRDIEIAPDFKFDLYFGHHNLHDRSCNHAFIHVEAGVETYDGIFLCSKLSLLSKKEINHRFPIEKKEWPIVASHPCRYDIVFISYFEKNADENYRRVNEKFGNVFRVDGVSGIHQAHIAAANCVSTDMFWVVDADAIIEDDFSFNYQIEKRDVHQRKTVHVWRSKNPINNLIYGYGGVKLLPTQLTLSMDTAQPDMTTSISTSFKLHHEISNITSFNTDEFSSWKSAFRECVKLSSKVIIGQDNTETDDRLDTWCNVGWNSPYGAYAIAGAIAGKEYGQKNTGNIPALYKINDFDWLLNQFNLI